MTKYSLMLKKLYDINLGNPVKMGLDNSHKLSKLLGNPLSNTPIIHVTGTNGKGSVTLKVAECFRHHNLRTGLFISPHISSFRERIQVNNEKISEEEFIEYFTEITSLCKSNNVPATFFEIATAMGFTHFHRKACDVVALEVGLGGRLDATNVIQLTPEAKNQSLSIITSIQLDHVKILGNTIEQIAYEKAGIMKPGVKCLVGPGCPIDFLRNHARGVGAPFYTLNDVLTPSQRLYEYTDDEDDLQDIDYLNTDIALAAMTLIQEYSPKLTSSSSSLFLPNNISSHLSNSHSNTTNIQKDITTNTNTDTSNTISTTTAASTTTVFDKISTQLRDIPWEELQSTLVVTRPPCRFENLNLRVHLEGSEDDPRQIVGVDVIMDIAHNLDAMAALMERMNKYFPHHPFRVVLGMSADKDVEAVVRILLTHVPPENIFCVAARTPRALSAKELSSIIQEISSSMKTSTPPPPPPSLHSELPVASSSSSSSHKDAVVDENKSDDHLSGDISTGIRSAIVSAATAAARRSDDIFVSKLIHSANNTTQDGNNSSSNSIGQGFNFNQLIQQEEQKQQQQQLVGHDINKQIDNNSSSNNNDERERGVVLICGTAFIMAEARATLGIIEPRDAESLAEATALLLTQDSQQSLETSIGSSSSMNSSGGSDTHNPVVYKDAQEYFEPSTSSTSTKAL